MDPKRGTRKTGWFSFGLRTYKRKFPNLGRVILGRLLSAKRGVSSEALFWHSSRRLVVVFVPDLIRECWHDAEFGIRTLLV